MNLEWLLNLPRKGLFMKITLNNVIPHPLESINKSSDSLWGNLIELNKGKRVILNASSGKGKSIFTTTSIGLRKDYIW